MTTTEPLCTTGQIAEFLAKPASWVYDNAARLGIPRFRVGNQYRYRLSEVAAWVESQGETCVSEPHRVGERA